MPNLRTQGKYCKRGHDVSVTGLYTKNTCRECAKENVQARRALYGKPSPSKRNKERRLEYYQENIEKMRAQKRADYYKHRSRRIKAVREYTKERMQTEQGREAHRQTNARWRANNRLHIRERGRLRGSGVSLEMATAIRDYYGTACVYCGADASGFDHLIPVSQEGPTSFENLAPCCWTCNATKGARPIWVMLKGGEA